MGSEYCVYVAIPERVNVPIVINVTDSSVELSYDAPAYSHHSEVIKYMLQYRVVGDAEWQSMPETLSLRQVVTGLEENTVYSFVVSARYAGGPWGSPSPRLSVKTKATEPSKSYLCVRTKC